MTENSSHPEETDMSLVLIEDIDEVLKKCLPKLNAEEQFSIMFKVIIMLSVFMVKGSIKNNHVSKLFIVEELHKAIRYHVNKIDKSLN